MSVAPSPSKTVPIRGCWLGPLFVFDLIRQSRKGRGLLYRLFFPAILLGFFALQLGEEITTKNLSQATDRFVSQYFLTERILIFLITPLLVCPFLMEEIRTKNLEWLLISDLTASEILKGKLQGSAGPILMLIMAGFPVMALMQFLGGVNIVMVSLMALRDCAIVWLLSSSSAVMLFQFRNVAGAVAASYFSGTFLAIIIYVVCYGLFALTIPVFQVILESLLLFITAQHFFKIAARQLQGSDIPSGNAYDPIGMPTITVTHEKMPAKLLSIADDSGSSCHVEEEQESIVTRVTREVAIPPVGNSSIIWREKYFPDGTLVMIWSASLLALTFVFLMMMWLITTAEDSRISSAESVNNGLYFFILLFSICLMLVAGLNATSLFSKEVLADRLIDFLLMPMTWHQILNDKLLGCLLRYRWLLIGWGVLCGVNLFFSFWGTLVFASTFLLQLLVIVSFFAMLSIMLRSSGKVRAVFLILLVIWFFTLVPISQITLERNFRLNLGLAIFSGSLCLNLIPPGMIGFYALKMDWASGRLPINTLEEGLFFVLSWLIALLILASCYWFCRNAMVHALRNAMDRK